MECPNCGTENRDVALFCQHCGTRLSIAEPTANEGLPSTAPTQELAEYPALQDTPVLETGPEAGPKAGLDGTEASQDQVPEPQYADLPETEPSPVAPLSASGETMPPAPADEWLAPEPQAVETQEDAVYGAASGAAGSGTESVQEPPAWNETEAQPGALAPSEPAAEAASYGDAAWEEELEPLPESAWVDQPEEDWEHAEGQEPAAADVSTEESAAASDWTDDELPEASPPILEEQDLAEAQQPPWTGEQAPLPALELGTVLDGRYQVVEIVETTPTYIQYQVRDLQRCPLCGTVSHSPDEAFCTSCGALMDQKPVANMRQQPASNDELPAGIEPEDQVIEDEQIYLIWRESAQEAVSVTEGLMRLIVGQSSDTGQVRELDEDSILAMTMSYTYESVTHQLGLFIVADGMGGHEGGEVASRLAIQTTANALLRDLFLPELAGSSLAAQEILDRMTAAIHQANDLVYLERQKRDNDMGTTITAAFVKDWTLHLGHVGDCRAYRWGQEGLQQLTTDHSIVAGMVAAGTILPEEIYTHPQRSVIYRCIGDQPTVEVDVGTVQLSPGDRLLVCCDGLWEELRNAGIEDILLAEADPQTACDRLVHQANVAGGSDNISVITVQL